MEGRNVFVFILYIHETKILTLTLFIKTLCLNNQTYVFVYIFKLAANSFTAHTRTNTHLLQAVKHASLRKLADLYLCYVSFQNEFPLLVIPTTAGRKDISSMLTAMLKLKLIRRALVRVMSKPGVTQKNLKMRC